MSFFRHLQPDNANMPLAGWTHHPDEWWHYNLPDPTRYPPFSDGAEGSFGMD